MRRVWPCPLPTLLRNTCFAPLALSKYDFFPFFALLHLAYHFCNFFAYFYSSSSKMFQPHFAWHIIQRMQVGRKSLNYCSWFHIF